MNGSHVVYEILTYVRPAAILDNVTIATPPDVEQKQVATVFINLLVPPILITIGVMCNAMTIMTMRTKHFRHVSTSVYLKSGAVNDVLALLISLSAHWLYVNLPDVYVRTNSSHFMCKFFNFYGSGNNDLGLLLTASMTAERALAIASPFGAAKFSSVERAWKIVIGIITFVVIKNMHFLLSSDIVPAGRTDRLCDVFPERQGHVYERFWYDVWPWMHLTYVLLCGILIVINNSVILYFVHKSQSDRSPRSSGGHNWRHLVPMLIGESVLLIVLTFPFSLHLALLAIRLKYDSTIYTDPKKAATETLVFNATFYMLYSNKCANFFMYCVTGSRFRDGLSSTLLDCFFSKSKRIKEQWNSSGLIASISAKIPSRRLKEKLKSKRRRGRSRSAKTMKSDDFMSEETQYDIADIRDEIDGKCDDFMKDDVQYAIEGSSDSINSGDSVQEDGECDIDKVPDIIKSGRVIREDNNLNKPCDTVDDIPENVKSVDVDHERLDNNITHYRYVLELSDWQERTQESLSFYI